jgi:hypothetical protein
MKLFILFAINFMIGTSANAAACCGGSVSVPALITGDDRALLNTSFAYSSIDTDVSSSGIWSKRGDHEISDVYRIEGARIFADRFQAGGSIPVAQRSSDRTNGDTLLGDITANLGYEYLPEWDYSPWRPRGFGFLQLTLPTGKSVNESADPSYLDATGRGFWALGAGTVLTKTIVPWDVSTTFEFHRAFAKSTRDASIGEDIQLHPGWGGTLGVSGGWNWRELRLGGGIAWTYEDPVAVTGAIEDQGAAQRYATATLVASYMMPRDWTVSVAYADQTWFGSPNNTTLSKSILASLQKRWER